MTATTRPKHKHLKRRRLRLPSMEALGFTDRTDTISSGGTVPSTTTGDLASSADAESFTIEPTVADWQPNEVGSKLLSGNVRWHLVLLAAIALSALGVAAYWLYQQPERAEKDALRSVTSDAAALDGHLSALAALNTALTAETAAPDTLAGDLALADGQARALFDASGALPSSAKTTRSYAADAAGETLAASRLLRDAYAYRTALIPILAVPEFETDAAFIHLDEAALAFGEFQSSFDKVKAALPSAVLSDVTAELDLISGELASVQSRYLDGLRDGETASSASAISSLSDRLEGVEDLLAVTLAEVQLRVAGRIASARTSIELLLG